MGWMRNLAWVAGCSGAVACASGSTDDLLVSGEDFLTEGDVSSLPSGNATGSNRNGFYRLESFGVVNQACAAGNVNEVFGILEPGAKAFIFNHVDGTASMLIWDQIPAEEPVFAGGLEANGDFALGAVSDVTTTDGEVVGEVFYRVDGNVDDGGFMDSTWRQRVMYEIGSSRADCEAEVVITARFEPGAEGDPCTLDGDCGAVAPYCVDMVCHDGTVGDPCLDINDCFSGSNCEGTPGVCR